MTIDERIQALTINIESLHANIHELYETVQRNAEASEKRLASAERSIDELKEMNMRLANIVIRHDERLDALDGGDQ